MNRFRIKNDKLLLKTRTHAEITVLSPVTRQALLATATDLISLALDWRRLDNPENAYLLLTMRERQVLEMRERGMSVATIARLLKIERRSVYRHIEHIMAKLDRFWQAQQTPSVQAPKLYRKVAVQTIPASALTTLDDDGEECAFDFGDDGVASWENYRQLELQTPLEQSDTYRAIKEPRQRELARYLAAGCNIKQAASKMGIGAQAAYQLAARMRRAIKDAKVV